MGLTDGQLAWMRATATAALPESCTVSRPAASSDGMGGRTLTYTAHATAVPVRVSPTSSLEAGETELAGRLSGRKAWTLTFVDHVDVALTDRITTSSRTFEVVALDGERSWELTRRVHCVEVL